MFMNTENKETMNFHLNTFDLMRHSISNMPQNENDYFINDSKNKRKIRNKFTPEEDEKLKNLVKEHGERSWNLISSLMGTRSQRQCRERWKHYLSCDAKEASKPWTKEEDAIIIQRFKELGSKWTKIARELPGRSDLQVKIRYMKNLKNKKRHSKFESEESESSDEFYLEEENEEESKNKIADNKKQIQQKNCEQEIKPCNADTIPIMTNSDSLNHDFNYDFDLNLDFGFTSTNLITELCQNNQDDIFFPTLENDFISWSFE